MQSFLHNSNILGALILLICLFPTIGLSGPCDAPAGLSLWSSLYGTNPGDIVVNTPVLVDVPTVVAQGITIASGGAVHFDKTKPIQFTANYILITANGALYAGTEACPITQKVIITLAGSPGVVNSQFGANFIGVAAGGTLELHGAKGLGAAWTKLNKTALAGTTSIQVIGNLNSWQVGDKIVIATTDYSPLQNEVVTISSIVGSNIYFAPALQYTHYGLITQNIDQRAEVGLLTRNLVIQGAPQAPYFGGHMMAMRGFSQVHIEGVEFNNMGQDQIARYPIHFHLCNNVPVGTYVKYNSIHDSNFRCVTIHATNGLLVEGNVAYNTIGHCYFLEDGVEQNNIIRGNLAVLTKPKDFGQRIGSDASNAGLSSYWITNPNNVIDGNTAVGSYTAGFWIITRLGARGAAACMPEYQNLPYVISHLPLGSFRDNTAHSCDFGLGAESTFWDSGDVPAQSCDTPVSNWEPRNADGSLSWTYIEGLTAHHNRQRGFWARLPNVVINAGRFADNYESLEFATSGDHPPYASQQIVQNSIIVGFSDNKGNKNEPSTLWQVWDNNLQSTIATTAVVSPINGIKIYDGPQIIVNTVFQSFPNTPGRPADAPIGARLADQSQVATTNYLQNVQFIGVGTRYSVIDNSMDGGFTNNFRDIDGSVSGYQGATMLRDHPFYATPGCKSSSSYMLACPHKYNQLWVLDMTANGNNNYMYLTRSEGADPAKATLPFAGFASGPVWRYQPIVSVGGSYVLRFQSRVPASLTLQINNAEQGERVNLAICYPTGTIIQSVQRGYAGYYGNIWPSYQPQSLVTPLPPIGSISSPNGYFYDPANSILYVTLQQRNARTEYGNFCPTQGCDFIWINAQYPVTGAARDCTAQAYATGAMSATSDWLFQELEPANKVPAVLGSLLNGIFSTPSTAPVIANTPAPVVFPTLPPRPATTAPTSAPTANPTSAPTTNPTSAPTINPTGAPTTNPTAAPTAKAATAAPTAAPVAPTAAPVAPTAAPTTNPTSAPTTRPTAAPTTKATTPTKKAATAAPTRAPAKSATAAPTRAAPGASLTGAAGGALPGGALPVDALPAAGAEAADAEPADAATLPVMPVCTANCPASMSCCGNGCYFAGDYTCYSSGLLCLKGFSACGNSCYPPSQYSCLGGLLHRI